MYYMLNMTETIITIQLPLWVELVHKTSHNKCH